MDTNRVLQLADRIRFWQEMERQAFRCLKNYDELEIYFNGWVPTLVTKGGMRFYNTLVFCQIRQLQAIQTLKSYLNETEN